MQTPSRTSGTSGTSGNSRYIVRAATDDAALATFIAALGNNPAVRLVEAIGPQGHPHTAVIETDARTAEQLEQSFRHANQLMIEPDRPLSLFD